jgi:hypothetical protein
VSKDSIRKKIDEAKRDAEDLLKSGTVKSETAAVIKSLILVIDIVVMVLLEKKIRKNSSNSGLPPSKNNGSNGNRNNGSGMRSEVNGSAANTRHVNTQEITSPQECSKCGEDLDSVPPKDTEERVKIDIIYEIVTHTVSAEIKECPNCHEINKGSFPQGMDGQVQYGIGIKSMIINFLCVQMMSLQRTQEHLKEIIGRSLSQAIMLKYLLQFSASLKQWEEDQIKALLSSKVIHCDETSVRIDKINWWVHSYSSGEITLKFVHRHRGREAIEDIGIIPKYKGDIVHDCWASYLSYGNVRHGLCGGHLLRELKFVEDSNGYTWATKIKSILIEAVEQVNSRPGRRVLTKEEYRSFQSRYRNALTRGLEEMPPFPEKSGKRGRTQKTDAQNLWCRLKEHEEAVLLFAKVKHVDFTNNRAERDLRVSKVKQKVSGCFRTYEMAQAFYRISSYVKSMRYRGYSAIEAITLALQERIPS